MMHHRRAPKPAGQEDFLQSLYETRHIMPHVPNPCKIIRNFFEWVGAVVKSASAHQMHLYPMESVNQPLYPFTYYPHQILVPAHYSDSNYASRTQGSVHHHTCPIHQVHYVQSRSRRPSRVVPSATPPHPQVQILQPSSTPAQTHQQMLSSAPPIIVAPPGAAVRDEACSCGLALLHPWQQQQQQVHCHHQNLQQAYPSHPQQQVASAAAARALVPPPIRCQAKERSQYCFETAAKPRAPQGSYTTVNTTATASGARPVPQRANGARPKNALSARWRKTAPPVGRGVILPADLYGQYELYLPGQDSTGRALEWKFVELQDDDEGTNDVLSL
eukprot:Lankesteria_metandrocarpae@DN6247_c0_g1_i1.p1